MKNLERQESVVKEFEITDVNGVNHKAVLVGVLKVEKGTGFKDKETVMFKKNGTVVTTITEWEEKFVIKELYIGLAITNPTDDVYSLEYGTLRAKGRALKPSKRLGHITTDSKSMLGIDMCNAIIDQQISFIQANAGLFIKVKKNELPAGAAVPEQAI